MLSKERLDWFAGKGGLREKVLYSGGMNLLTTDFLLQRVELHTRCASQWNVRDAEQKSDSGKSVCVGQR